MHGSKISYQDFISWNHAFVRTMFSAVYAYMFEQTFKKWQFRSHFPPFWPIFRPRWVKTASFFFLTLRPNQFQRGVMCLCLNKPSKSGIFSPKTGYQAKKRQKMTFSNNEKKTPAGNIPTFRKTQENNFQDHPGKSQQGKFIFIEILARK